MRLAAQLLEPESDDSLSTWNFFEAATDTHYPVLRATVEEVARAVLGHDTRVVDSAEATAHELVELISARGLARDVSVDARAEGSLRLMVTDRPQSFADVAARFLGHALPEVELIDL